MQIISSKILETIKKHLLCSVFRKIYLGICLWINMSFLDPKYHLYIRYKKINLKWKQFSHHHVTFNL